MTLLHSRRHFAIYQDLGLTSVFTKVRWRRLLVFLNFVEQLGLTNYKEEWKQLFDFVDPTLTQKQE